jgi:hypothetical protein
MNEPASFSDGFDGFVSLTEADKDKVDTIAEVNDIEPEEVEEAVEGKAGEENPLVEEEKEEVEKDRSNLYDYPPYEVCTALCDYVL